LADEIQEKFELATRLKKSAGGAFEVRLDGDLVFSKHESGRFPDPGEVEAALAMRLARTKEQPTRLN